MEFKKQKTTLLITSILGLIISIFYKVSTIVDDNGYIYHTEASILYKEILYERCSI